MPSRVLFVAVALLCGGCRCGNTSVTGAPSLPLDVRPSRLDFGAAYVGASRALQLTATNRGRAPRTLTLAGAAPFGVTPGDLTLGGGDEVTVDVRFTPTAAGPFTTVLRVDETDVALEGVGLEPLTCTAAACHGSTFDPVEGRCVDVVQTDGTDCTATRTCFASATCFGGECVGTLTTCDDANPCTLDVCGETGCGHLDDLLSCPQPANPCQAAACDPRTGCGSVDVPDGTSCGLRDCSTAQVCIAGACVSRPVPQTQGCVEVVAGRPGGIGIADGVGPAARFAPRLRIAASETGVLWVFDDWYRQLRTVSPSGVVTTVAGNASPYFSGGWTDGFGGAATFLNPGDVDLGPSAVATVVEAGVARHVTPAGLVVTWLGRLDLTSFPDMRDGIGPAAQLGHGIAVATSATGEVWLVDADAAQVVLRHASATGELRTVAPLGPAVHLRGLDLAWVSGELWYADEAQGVSRVLADGGLAPVADAGVRRLSGSRSGEVALASLHGVRVLRPDGGVLDHAFPEPDFIMDVAALPRGGWALAVGRGLEVSADSARIEVLDDDGGMRLLAGPAARLPVQDGPIATAGLDDPQGVAVDGAGRVLVYERDRVRAIAGGQVTMVCAMPGDGFRDLAALAAGAVAATTSSGVALLDGTDGGALVLSGGAIGVDSLGDVLAVAGWGAWLSDAGFIPGPTTLGAMDVALDGQGGLFLVQGAHVSHVDGLGATTLVAGSPVAGDLDGVGAAARFGLLGSITRGASGDLFVADQTNRSVRRVTPTGAVTTIVRLADVPQRLTAGDGGTLLVTVSDAVLRVHP